MAPHEFFVLGFQVGKGIGIAKPPHPSMIELGPVLTQMCVGEDIDYDFHTFGLVNAGSKPLKELNQVLMAVGTLPAERMQELISP